jgi:HSP20 family protein
MDRKGGETMTQLDIWSEMMALERRFDDFVRELLGPRARMSFPSLPSGLHKPFIPSTDVLTRDGTTVIRLDLPGIDPDKDITVTVSDDELVVSGERKHKEEVKDDDYYRMEASFGSFERHFPLIERVAEKDIHARYENGVLEIVFPAAKAVPSTKAKEIPIKGGKVQSGKAA